MKRLLGDVRPDKWLVILVSVLGLVAFGYLLTVFLFLLRLEN